MSNAKQREKRFGSRIKCHVSYTSSLPGNALVVLHGFVMDVSLSGAKVVVAGIQDEDIAAMKSGEFAVTVKLQEYLPDSVVEGHLRWHETHGSTHLLGLRFRQNQPVLTELIGLLRGNPRQAHANYQSFAAVAVVAVLVGMGISFFATQKANLAAPTAKVVAPLGPSVVKNKQAQHDKDLQAKSNDVEVDPQIRAKYDEEAKKPAKPSDLGPFSDFNVHYEARSIEVRIVLDPSQMPEPVSLRLRPIGPDGEPIPGCEGEKLNLEPGVPSIFTCASKTDLPGGTSITVDQTF